MKLRCLVLALAMCGSLTACDVCPPTVKSTASRSESPQGVANTFGFEVAWNPGSSSCRLHRFSSTGLDVSNIAIDIAGQGTAVLDGSGTGTLLLTQGGTVIGLTTFDYAVMDSMAVVADPATVNAWLDHYPSADGYNVELHDIDTVDTQPGVATLTVETLYENDVMSTASTSWASSAGSGCENPNGNHGNPFPDQPIELPGDGGVCP